MKLLCLIIVIVLCQNLCHAQNLFFIGEKSFPSTETFEMKSNSDYHYSDLDVLIAKDADKGLIVVSTEIMGGGVRIKGKIIIYLDDGTVITCIDRNRFDFINNIATTIYSLTSDELDKMKESNINTIRFTLKCYECIESTEEGTFSASNKDSNSSYSRTRADVPKLINTLFN